MKRSEDLLHGRLKSLLPRDWEARRAQVFTFYCPLCATERRSTLTPRIGSRHYFRVGVAAMAVTLALWPWLGIRGLVSFLPMWVVFESVYRVRSRAKLVCSQCGFDPVLYLADRKKAREDVVEFWKQKLGPAVVATAGEVSSAHGAVTSEASSAAKSS